MRPTKSILSMLAVATGAMLLAAPAFAADDSGRPDSSRVARGAQAWADNCGRCHNLRGPQEFSARSWGPIVMHMRVRANLPGQTAKDILAFLQASAQPIQQRSVVPSTPSPAAARATGGDAERGGALFSQTCVACHGPDGKGVVPGTPDFTKKDGVLSLSDSTLEERIESGFHTPGSPMAMPPRGGNPKLSDRDIEDILAYLHQAFGN